MKTRCGDEIRVLRSVSARRIVLSVHTAKTYCECSLTPAEWRRIVASGETEAKAIKGAK